MYLFIILICLGVGIFLSKKIDENWENGLYDHLYQEEEPEDNEEEILEEDNGEELQDFDEFNKKN